MDRINTLIKRLQENETIILDSAMGTEIQRRGIRTDLPLWSAGALQTNPKVICQIHEDNIRAGADIISTNTFRTNRRTFQKIGKPELAQEFTEIACSLAIEAREHIGSNGVVIAGGLAPLEDCYEINLVPSDSELQEEHGEWAQSLADSGVDFIFVETMNCIRESTAALDAAVNTGLPVAISYVADDNGNLLSGESIEDAVSAFMNFEPFAILTNCRPLGTTDCAVSKLASCCPVSFGVYANGAGKPHDEQGWIFEGSDPELMYVDHAINWLDAGATIIGGCCGTTPNFTKALQELVECRIAIV